MRTFYIITNSSKDPDYLVTNKIKKLIETSGGKAIIADEVEGISSLLDDITCILSLGGDGTLIRAAGELHEHETPLIGVNLGTLGYLTEIERNTLEVDIMQLVNGETFIEERMMLAGHVKDEKEVALNDIVLTREGDVRTIRFQIYVNGSYLHSYKADGIIVSTPTGSSGYSMSAGGPIVEPTASLFIMTPICSHSLNNKSIILSSDDVIEIVLGEGREGAVEVANVSFDGGKSSQILTGDRVKITKADKTMKLMKLSSESFLDTLRKKMVGN